MTIRCPEPPRRAQRASLVALLSLATALASSCERTRDSVAPPGTVTALPTPSALASPEPPGTAHDALAATPPAIASDARTATPPAVASDLPSAPSPVLPAGVPPSGAELARFHAALRELEAGTRKRHVHIEWLGDSHGQADFWSGALRKSLQARFGSGGPGFVYAGYKNYRHDDVGVSLDGRWALRPAPPATQSRTRDGAFGLGGITARPTVGGSRVTLTTTGVAAPSKVTIDLCYKLGAKGDGLSVSVGGKAPRDLKPGDALGAIQHATLESDAPARLDITAASGEPELCGAVIETDPTARAGVVLDTLGINGARYRTALAWDAAAWSAELERREPELVILEYGTNEAGDRHADPASYGEQIGQLMSRVRNVSPAADCLVLSLTDRADTEERNPAVRDAQKAGAAAHGCAFWDTYEVMGGKGAIRRWQAGPKPLAAGDGVHLTPRGYRELGERLGSDILRGY